jgi:hypothetical protein
MQLWRYKNCIVASSRSRTCGYKPAVGSIWQLLDSALLQAKILALAG